MDRFILNETSYFGRGCREVLPGLLKEKGFNTVLLVTDKALVDAGVTNKVTELLEREEKIPVIIDDRLKEMICVRFLKIFVLL